MILDTSFLVDLFLNRKEAVVVAKEIQENEILKTTSISIYEIVRGIKNEDNFAKIEQFFNDIIVLPLDKEAGKKAGKISNELIRAGKEIDPEDCMIAAITILNNEKLLTKNLNHFKRIKNLDIKSY